MLPAVLAWPRLGRGQAGARALLFPRSPKVDWSPFLALLGRRRATSTKYYAVTMEYCGLFWPQVDKFVGRITKKWKAVLDVWIREGAIDLPL